MALERTLSIIKPDAVAKNAIGDIYARFEKAGLKIAAAKMLHLSRDDAAGFYAEHDGKPFFDALLEFMTSGPVMVQVLEGENAVAMNRELMGATNPKDAAAGTIRADFAESIDANAVHGSDAPASAARPAPAACRTTRTSSTGSTPACATGAPIRTGSGAQSLCRGEGGYRQCAGCRKCSSERGAPAGPCQPVSGK